MEDSMPRLQVAKMSLSGCDRRRCRDAGIFTMNRRALEEDLRIHTSRASQGRHGLRKPYSLELVKAVRVLP